MFLFGVILFEMWRFEALSQGARVSLKYSSTGLIPSCLSKGFTNILPKIQLTWATQSKAKSYAGTSLHSNFLVHSNQSYVTSYCDCILFSTYIIIFLWLWAHPDLEMYILDFLSVWFLLNILRLDGWKYVVVNFSFYIIDSLLITGHIVLHIYHYYTKLHTPIKCFR